MKRGGPKGASRQVGERQREEEREEEEEGMVERAFEGSSTRRRARPATRPTKGKLLPLLSAVSLLASSFFLLSRARARRFVIL